MKQSNYKYPCPKCGSNDFHYDVKVEDEWYCKCFVCNQVFHQSESLDYEWDQMHYNWVYKHGGKPAILDYIKKKSEGNVFKKEDDLVLDKPFFNYACYLLFGIRGDKIIKNSKAFFRDIEIDKLLS